MDSGREKHIVRMVVKHNDMYSFIGNIPDHKVAQVMEITTAGQKDGVLAEHRREFMPELRESGK